MNVLQLPSEGYATVQILGKAFVVIWSEKAYKKVKAIAGVYKSQEIQVCAIVIKLPHEKNSINALIQQMLYECPACVFVDYEYAFSAFKTDTEKIKALGELVACYITTFYKCLGNESISLKLREKLCSMFDAGIYVIGTASTGGELAPDAALHSALKNLSADMNLLKARQAYVLARCNPETPGQDDMYETESLLKKTMPEANVVKVRMETQDYSNTVIAVVKCI